jgi:hypothetical protein
MTAFHSLWPDRLSKAYCVAWLNDSQRAGTANVDTRIEPMGRCIVDNKRRTRRKS